MMKPKSRFVVPGCALLLALAAGGARGGEVVDFANAVVLSPPNASGPEKQAARMLVEEVEKRTQLRWKIVSAWPEQPGFVIALGQRAALAPLAGAFAKDWNIADNDTLAEGYHIRVMR